MISPTPSPGALIALFANRKHVLLMGTARGSQPQKLLSCSGEMKQPLPSKAEAALWFSFIFPSNIFSNKNGTWHGTCHPLPPAAQRVPVAAVSPFLGTFLVLCFTDNPQSWVKSRVVACWLDANWQQLKIVTLKLAINFIALGRDFAKPMLGTYMNRAEETA